jgi:hypothetical protein
MEVIWVRREEEYFFERGWTEVALNSPSGKSSKRTKQDVSRSGYFIVSI